MIKSAAVLTALALAIVLALESPEVAANCNSSHNSEIDTDQATCSCPANGSCYPNNTALQVCGTPQTGNCTVEVDAWWICSQDATLKINDTTTVGAFSGTNWSADDEEIDNPGGCYDWSINIDLAEACGTNNPCAAGEDLMTVYIHCD